MIDSFKRYTLEFTVNYKASVNSQWVSPTFSYTIFNLNDVRKVFFLFLLLIIIGEFFCCPSMTLADTAVLNLLGPENAVLTPHIAAGTEGAQIAQQEMVLGNLEAFFAGRPLLSPVSL